jgi:hypothetical protein
MDDLLREMIQPAAPSAHDRARRWRLVASAATLALAAVGVTSLTTSALFSDTDAVTGSAFTTGSVDVALAPGPSFLSIDKMAPGDTAYRSLTVKNPGSLEFRYAATKSWTDSTPQVPLSDVLLLSTYALPAGAECSATAEQGVDVRPAETMAAHGAALFGDAATGSQPGDRTIPAGGAEVLCFHIQLPVTAGADYRDSTSTVSIQVSAEQTANNP